jgi:hypothetical protein
MVLPFPPLSLAAKGLEKANGAARTRSAALIFRQDRVNGLFALARVQFRRKIRLIIRKAIGARLCA